MWRSGTRTAAQPSRNSAPHTSEKSVEATSSELVTCGGGRRGGSAAAVLSMGPGNSALQRGTSGNVRAIVDG